ncbi:hypothetical protein B0H17DRAFT_1131716 [Mycena rosella]|uniref:Uncharacterized protein n=1 Tax=Mycena rosella TaxID=1033263 RepID=A0AAD7DMM4_MYCRO|nr:hypothetical protein B0H17DRAFT_1131716 [Mycena rosella]
MSVDSEEADEGFESSGGHLTLRECLATTWKQDSKNDCSTELGKSHWGYRRHQQHHGGQIVDVYQICVPAVATATATASPFVNAIPATSTFLPASSYTGTRRTCRYGNYPWRARAVWSEGAHKYLQSLLVARAAYTILEIDTLVRHEQRLAARASRTGIPNHLLFNGARTGSSPRTKEFPNTAVDLDIQSRSRIPGLLIGNHGAREVRAETWGMMLKIFLPLGDSPERALLCVMRFRPVDDTQVHRSEDVLVLAQSSEKPKVVFDPLCLVTELPAYSASWKCCSYGATCIARQKIYRKHISLTLNLS